MTILGVTPLPEQVLPVSVPVPDAPAREGYLLCGRETGKTLVVCAGVHGCEYIGILAAQRLRNTLDLSRLRGQVLVLPLLNPTGFFRAARQVMPEDGKNLNQAFPGAADGTHTARVAQALEQLVFPAADFLIDLHSGDWFESLTPLVFFPVAAGAAVEHAAREAARCLNVPYRVASTAKNGLYSRAAQCGIPALLLERGCRAAWSEAEVQAALGDLSRLLAHLGMLDAPVSAAPQQEITRAVYEESPAAGFWTPQVQAGASVAAGQLLGTLTDAGGHEIRAYRAAFDGTVLYLSVILGVDAGDPLIAYGCG